MWKRVVVAALLGGLAMMVWTLVVNGVFWFKSRIDMKPIPDERKVYAVLEESVTEPGRYICNPEVVDGEGFPGGQPVFSVLYGGVGHEAAGWLALVRIPIFFISPLIAAWMLSLTSRRVLASYPRRVLFVASLGLLVGTYTRLTSFGIGDYPVEDAAALALHDVLLWAAVGAVMAWRVRAS